MSGDPKYCSSVSPRGVRCDKVTHKLMLMRAGTLVVNASEWAS